MIVVTLLPLLLAAAGECSAPAPDAASPCSNRNGYCFDLTLGAQPVIALHDAAARARFEDIVSQPVCWQVTDPVEPGLDAKAMPNAHTAKGLRSLFDELEIVLTGLEGQQIPTRKGIREDPTVRIGGVPMQTVVDVIDTDALPPGEYIATFRVRGPGGWDRKAVYLRIADPPAKVSDP